MRYHAIGRRRLEFPESKSALMFWSNRNSKEGIPMILHQELLRSALELLISPSQLMAECVVVRTLGHYVAIVKDPKLQRGRAAAAAAAGETEHEDIRKAVR
jgi:hypothetical protein